MISSKCFYSIIIIFFLFCIVSNEAEIFTNYYLALELFWPWRFRFHIFDQCGWFIPFCSDDFPGQCKRRCKREFSLSLSLPHIFFEQDRPILSFLNWTQQQTDRPLQQEESAFNTWATVSLGDHSFAIYSFLLDQLDLETSGWMPNSCSDIRNSFLLFVRLTVQGISSQADIKDLKLK